MTRHTKRKIKIKIKIKNAILKIIFSIIFLVFILACCCLDSNIYIFGSIAFISMILLALFYYVNHDYFMKEIN